MADFRGLSLDDTFERDFSGCPIFAAVLEVEEDGSAACEGDANEEAEDDDVAAMGASGCICSYFPLSAAGIPILAVSSSAGTLEPSEPGWTPCSGGRL